MFFEKLCFGAFLVMMTLTSNRVRTGQDFGLLPFMGGSGSSQTTAAVAETPYSGDLAWGQKSYRELAEDLRSMGLAVPEDLVQDLSEYAGDEMYKEYMRGNYDIDPAYGYREILMYMGYEHFGEDLDGTTSTHQVYALDFEMFDISSMYSEAMYGIISISGGEFAITDIEENTDQVDYENNEGVQILSFKYNGVPYTFEAKVNNDWLDINFFGFMNQVLKEQGNPKRILMTSDGGQGGILLYNTPEWGAQLDALTGLDIYDFTN